MNEEEYDELDYLYTDKLICPHCGTKYDQEEHVMYEDGNFECDVCGGISEVVIEWNQTYSTYVKCDRVTLEIVLNEGE